MKKLQRLIGAAVCLTGLAALTPATTFAFAGHDTEPPRLTTPPKASFVVGSQLHEFTADGDDDQNPFYEVPMRLTWSAKDDVDQELNFDVWQHPQGTEPSRIADFITASSFPVVATDYNGDFGGGSLIINNWSVQAYDGAANSIQRAIYGAQLSTTQDNRKQTLGAETSDVSLRYVGKWSQVTCACYAGGTIRRTSARDAAVVIRVNVPKAEDIRRVALVFDMGPNTGGARLLIDQKQRDILHTFRPVPRHQHIVWTGTLRPGLHHIRVENLATKGHARLQFDAVVVN